MLRPQAALRAALVTAMAFPHHRAQEKTKEKIAPVGLGGNARTSRAKESKGTL
jgi:hypothetical protein